MAVEAHHHHDGRRRMSDNEQQARAIRNIERRQGNFGKCRKLELAIFRGNHEIIGREIESNLSCEVQSRQ